MTKPDLSQTDVEQIFELAAFAYSQSQLKDNVFPLLRQLRDCYKESWTPYNYIDLGDSSLTSEFWRVSLDADGNLIGLVISVTIYHQHGEVREIENEFLVYIFGGTRECAIKLAKAYLADYLGR